MTTDMSQSKVKDQLDEVMKAIPPPPRTHGSATTVQFGIPRPAEQQILLFSFEEWEAFILEWVSSQRGDYLSIRRFSGSNDMGIDVAGFADDDGLFGTWDNFQCKHYSNPLSPAVAAAEIAKILWHSFNGRYVPPRKFYFIAPRGCGTKLSHILKTPGAIKKHVIENWNNQCSRKVAANQAIELEGEFKEYVDNFDYSVFVSRSPIEIVAEHRTTPYHAARFGGGLPVRPAASQPPADPELAESKYIQQLFEAYSDHMKFEVTDLSGLGGREDLSSHFHRQREFFYHAESLRNFARDTVPPGTFEDLKDEIYAGVIDLASSSYPDGYARLNGVTSEAAKLSLSSNALISVVKIHDRKGICHQLANDDRLTWRQP